MMDRGEMVRILERERLSFRPRLSHGEVGAMLWWLDTTKGSGSMSGQGVGGDAAMIDGGRGLALAIPRLLPPPGYVWRVAAVPIDTSAPEAALSVGGERMRRFTKIVPVVVEGEPNACNVFLVVGNQSFCVTPYACDDVAVAEVMQNALCQALERILAAERVEHGSHG